MKKWYALLGALLILFGILKAIESEKTFESLKDDVLRLHVLASSNSEEDQALKLEVRDELLRIAEPLLEEASDQGEAKEILRTYQRKIEEDLEAFLETKNNTTPLTVSIEDRGFPIKTYGTATLPGGTYEAFLVTLGEGEGDNWWCVLFPPLCLVDGSVDEGVFGEALHSYLTEDEITLITKDPDKVAVKIEFKILEIFDRIKKFFQKA